MHSNIFCVAIVIVGTCFKMAEQQQIHKVSLKVPPFWKKNVQVWFQQLESQFSAAGITSELTRYHHVIGTLETEVVAQIADILAEELPIAPYTMLKRRLITEFSDSDQRRFEKLLHETELGSKKPTCLLKEMRLLAGDGVNDSFLRNLFLQRLPVTTRAILAARTDSLNELAESADKILEVTGPHQQVAAASRTPPVEELQAQIAQLQQQIAALQTNRPRSRSRSNPRRRSSPVPTANVCWYHEKFGVRAQKCNKPCSYRPAKNE